MSLNYLLFSGKWTSTSLDILTDNSSCHWTAYFRPTMTWNLHRHYKWYFILHFYSYSNYYKHFDLQSFRCLHGFVPFIVNNILNRSPLSHMSHFKKEFFLTGDQNWTGLSRANLYGGVVREKPIWVKNMKMPHFRFLKLNLTPSYQVLTDG